MYVRTKGTDFRDLEYAIDNRQIYDPSTMTYLMYI